MAIKRKLIAFEILLLLIGLMVALTGILLLRTLYIESPGITWQFFSAVSIWLILLFVIVMAAVLVDVKEELSIIIGDQLEEIKLLREDLKRRK